MGLFDHFPYTNVHELNLDWVLSMMKALEAEREAFIAGNSLTFADPMLHDVTKTYAKNTIVLDGNGNAYVSLQAVPVGVGLQNGDYWLMVFDYEAFIEKVNKNFTARYYRGNYRATAAMVIGDWLTVDDVLCKATAAIAVDDLLEIGVNIDHFTLEDFIKAFMQSANQLIQQYKNDIDASELAYRQQLANDIANTTASLQAQLDAAISGATVDSEVINARVGADGITYSTLGEAIREQFTSDNIGIFGLSNTSGHPIQANDFKAEQYNAGNGTFTPNTSRATSKYSGINRGSDIFWDSSKWDLNYYVIRSDDSYIWSPNVWDSSGHITFNYSNNAYVVIQLRHPDSSSIAGDLDLMNEQVILFNNEFSEIYHGVISGTTLASNNLFGFYSLGGYNTPPTSDMTDMPVDDFTGGILLNTLCGNSGTTTRQDLIEIPISTRAARHFVKIGSGSWFGVGDINWVAYGDSITNGSYSQGNTTLNNSTHSYAFRIAKTIKRDTINKFYNCSVRGIGWLDTGNNGETLDDMLTLYTGDKTEINLVTIMLGINDYLTHNDPLGDESSTEKDGTISGNIRYCLRWVSENYDNAKVVVISPMNSTVYGSLSSGWSRNNYLINPHSLQDLSDMIKYWCDYFGIMFIDELASGFVSTYNCQQFMQDGIHPSDDGQWLLAHDVAAKLGI